ncbi:MAG: hypothetical protein KJ054_01580, partial [Gammaproteobacteria bacterium]|nr:hypothetical protein [Gammaproteobacteria bacterium]
MKSSERNMTGRITTKSIFRHLLIFLSAALSLPALAATPGITALAITADGTLLVSPPDQTVGPMNSDVIQTAGESADGDGEPLLAVGPAIIQSHLDRTWIDVLGVAIDIDINTAFPRNIPKPGDYVAVTGSTLPDGNMVAGNIVRLGGRYEPGNSLVYIRAPLVAIDQTGRATIGATQVDLAQALGESQISAEQINQIVQVAGFESSFSADSRVITATSAGVLSGHSNSGVKGINGSGVRGINGSGVRGINGSGVRGINGSGVRGINGSG